MIGFPPIASLAAASMNFSAGPIGVFAGKPAPIVMERKRFEFLLEAVQPVKWTPLEPWIRRGAGGRYVLKRLKERGRLLTPQALSRMRRIGEGFLGATQFSQRKAAGRQ